MIVWLCVSPFYLEFGVLDVLGAVSQCSYVCGDNLFQDAIPTTVKDSNNNLPKKDSSLNLLIWFLCFYFLRFVSFYFIVNRRTAITTHTTCVIFCKFICDLFCIYFFLCPVSFRLLCHLRVLCCINYFCLCHTYCPFIVFYGC